MSSDGDISGFVNPFVRIPGPKSDGVDAWLPCRLRRQPRIFRPLGRDSYRALQRKGDVLLESRRFAGAQQDLAYGAF